MHPETLENINASTIHYGPTITALQAVQPDFPTAALNVHQYNKISSIDCKNLQTAVTRR
jgi:hypothetical protein